MFNLPITVYLTRKDLSKRVVNYQYLETYRSKSNIFHAQTQPKTIPNHLFGGRRVNSISIHEIYLVKQKFIGIGNFTEKI